MTVTPAHTDQILTLALEYAERGWPVFPCHGIAGNGACTCAMGSACERPGKHPRISNGRNGATTDPDRIEAWWRAWPGSNVAVATGRESGVIVIDIDSEEAAAYVAAQGVPLTLEQRTGSGGAHLLFFRPEGDERYRTATSIGGVPGLDSRADGGYIVAPPSKHASGGHYEWHAGTDPAPCPQWWAELLRAPALGGGPVEVPAWNPDGELPRNITEILEHIPADEYTVWRDVGMAIHYTDPSEDGFRVFDWWSSTSGKYDAASVRKEWRNWSRRGHAVANPVTLATVRRIAEGLGWTDPYAEHGAIVAAQWRESAQLRVVEAIQASVRPTSLPEPPGGLTPEHGLIADIARWIDATSIRPQPRLSLAAALSFVATLAGRRYASPTNLRTNLYIIGLAPTGAGKNHARSCIQKLATWAGADDFLGADHIASGSAIVNSLKGQPVKLYLLDEFGLLLQSLTNQNAGGHRREIITRLIELYSLAQSSYRGVEYADAESKPRTVIQNPHVCVYGTSTGASFWPALSGSHVLDGTLNRLLIVDAGDSVPARLRSVNTGDPPEEIVRLVKEMIAAEPEGPSRGNLNGRGGHRVGQVAHVVSMTTEVQDAEFDFAHEMDHIADSDTGRAIYSRVAENATKLALAHAVSLDPNSPWIGPESWTWGRDVALWCANALMYHAKRHIFENETEKNLRRVYAAAQTRGDDGVTQSDLIRATRSMGKRAREEAVEALAQMNALIQVKKKPAGAGRTSVRWVALAPDPFDS